VQHRRGHLHTQIRWALAGLCLTLFLSACGDEPVAPRIEAILPDHGPPGESVDLVGERFGETGSQRQVSFGGVPAQVSLWQAGRARVVVPSRSAGLTLVTVTVDGRPSNAVNFQIE
jgi:hypothetical protein